MSVETRAVLKAYFETGDKPTAAQFGNLIDSFLSWASDLQIGLFTVTQSGTSAPVLTERFSTLSFTPTAAYDSVGTYTLDSIGNLEAGKTFVFFGGTTATPFIPLAWDNGAPDSWDINTYDSSATLANDILGTTPLLIIKLT